MKDFFFDTADVESLKRVYNDVKNDIPGSLIRGITCNPGIMAKAGKHTLKECLETLPKLCDILSNIAGGTKEIHVQFPSSQGTSQDIEQFYELLDKLKLSCRIVIKVPPWRKLLQEITNLYSLSWCQINVTGLTESGTILKCSPYADYCSIIPGRMLKNGLSYKKHLAFAVEHVDMCYIIAGALYDELQVADCMKLGAKCTIGLKTWDLIINEKKLDFLLGLEYKEIEAPEFIPEVTAIHTNLSRAFFEEMDEFGEQAFQDFKNLKK